VLFRPGYSHLSEPVSALAAGPNGWVQDVNFFVFGNQARGSDPRANRLHLRDPFLRRAACPHSRHGSVLFPSCRRRHCLPLFLAGRLASEVFSHGLAVVVDSVPGYEVSINSVLMVQGLQYVTLVPGQVALGVALVVLSFAGLGSDVLPKWMSWLGLTAGMINFVRPFAMTSPPILLATFMRTFIWIAATSIALIRRSSTPST
jgi:hypothetical protein